MKEKIPMAVRHAVWSKYIGNHYHSKCFCCNSEIITKANYECGHIISEKNGGKVDIHNLRPICSSCNKSVGSRNMDEFMQRYGLDKCSNWYGIDSRCQLGDSPKKEDKKYLDIFWRLTIRELKNICNFYRISFPSVVRKAELVTLLVNNNADYNKYLKMSLNNFSIVELKKVCEQLELPKTGNKEVLIETIVNSHWIIELTDLQSEREISEEPQQRRMQDSSHRNPDAPRENSCLIS